MIGTINCSTSASIASIAVQRSGLFWVLTRDAKLYAYNSSTALCTETVFVRNQTINGGISMAFVKNETDSSEDLYVSYGSVMGKVELNRLTGSIVGNYTNGSSPALSGANDGRLFGLFLETPFVIRQLDKTNAQFINQYPLPYRFDGTLYNFAYVPFNSSFLLMSGYSNFTVMSVFDPSTNTNTNLTSLPVSNFYRGAVSTCFGT